MSIQTETKPVKLSYEKTNPTQGEIHIEHRDDKARLKQALMFWLGGWALAAISVFFPLAHFVLVPGFLIGGPVVGYFKYKQVSRITGGKSVCPVCQSELPISAGNLQFPFEELCNQCWKKIKVDLV